MRCLLFLCVLALVRAQGGPPGFDWDDVTPLDEYVWRIDGYAERSEPIAVYEEEAATVYVLNITSQKWMDETYTDSSIWWHYLSIAIPHEPRILDAAHLYVDGGNNNDGPPAMSMSRMRYISDFASEVGAVAALLRQDPNQPVFFEDSPNVPRTEDMIIARTWRHYIESEEENPNTDMILNLPMTKAGKVAADFMIEFANEVNPDIQIESYMPAGFSKRGWVSWLLAACDPRVFATAPIVLDILNWHENLHHHYMAYGGWSWAFSPYWMEEVSKYIDHERSAEVFEEVAIDPLAYNPRLTMPKLLSIGTCDQFFLPDDTHYFWDELNEPKFLCLFENADHGMGGHGSRLNDHLMAFFKASYQDMKEDFDWPDMRWERIDNPGDEDGFLTVHLDREPNTYTGFWADTTNVSCIDDRNRTEEGCRRDFRQRTLNFDNPIFFEEFDESDIDVFGDGRSFRVSMDYRPEVTEEGWRAFFMSFTFDGVDEGDVLDFTSEIHIIQDYLPFPRCQTEEECRGHLK